MRDEVVRLREMGLEPIPKLNFSTCHDAWLGPYARMVSTPQYYQVVKDLIAETIEMFGNPRLFHLGMDEEALVHQRQFEYVAQPAPAELQPIGNFAKKMRQSGLRSASPQPNHPFLLNGGLRCRLQP